LPAGPRGGGRGDFDMEMVQLRAKGPAAGLLVTALLFLAQMVVVGGLLVATVLPGLERQYYNSGHPAVTPDAFWLLFAGGSALVLLLTATMVAGALKLARLASYELVMVAIILAMCPLGYQWLLGFPMGCWALWVVTRPEVKAGFARNLRKSKEPRADSTAPFSTGGGETPSADEGPGRVRSFFGSMLSMFVPRATAANPTPAAGLDKEEQPQAQAGGSAEITPRRPGDAAEAHEAGQTHEETRAPATGKRYGLSCLAPLLLVGAGLTVIAGGIVALLLALGLPLG